ncbi:MAG: TRAP transporter large permease subunit, partial [Chloroflexota bacterium]
KEAAAIEACASNGGQIMPPVMGAAAFVMAMVTGISYVTIMAAALIPALLYFLSLGMYCQLLAMKRNITPMASLGGSPDYRQMLLALPGFAIPLVVIVVLFIKGFSPMYVAFWAVIATAIMAILKPGKRLTGRQWLEGFTSGFMSGAIIAVSLATIGIVTKVLTVSGLGVKLPGIVEVLSSGNLLVALLLVLAVSIILGMGVPTTPAYILVAMVGAPVLVQLGVGLLPAHFFVFYYAVMALITPPVASAAIVSSQIAGASYVATSVEAIKIAAPSLLVPFIFIKNPIFLMQPGEGWLEGTVALFAGLLLVLATSIAFVNHFLTRLSGWERLAFALCAQLCFVYFMVWSNYAIALAGLVLFALLTLNQLRQQRPALTAPS